MSQYKINQPLNGKNKTSMPDPEVVPQAKRRQFSAEYKLRIVQEAEQCRDPGEIGTLLRREGLYSSHLSNWRRQQRQGQLQGLQGQKRGRKSDPEAAALKQLRRENERLQQQLERAELIIDVQKKVSQMLGLPPSQIDEHE